MDQSQITCTQAEGMDTLCCVTCVEVTEDSQHVILGTTIGFQIYKTQNLSLVFKDTNPTLFINGIRIITPLYQNFRFLITTDCGGPEQATFVYDSVQK